MTDNTPNPSDPSRIPAKPKDMSRRSFFQPDAFRAFLEALQKTDKPVADTGQAAQNKMNRREFTKKSATATVAIALIPEIAGGEAAAAATTTTGAYVATVEQVGYGLFERVASDRLLAFFTKSCGAPPFNPYEREWLRLAPAMNEKILRGLIKTRGEDFTRQAVRYAEKVYNIEFNLKSNFFFDLYEEEKAKWLKTGKTFEPVTKEQITRFLAEADREAWKAFSARFEDILKWPSNGEQEFTKNSVALAVYLSNIELKWQPATKKLRFIRPDLDAMDMSFQGADVRKEARRALMRQFEDMLCQYDPELASKITHSSAAGLVIKQPPEDLLKILGINPAQPYHSESGPAR